MQYLTNVFKTSDGLWHLQIYRECESDIQVLRVWTLPRLIDTIEMASALQLHVNNIQELPISQYALQSNYNESRFAA